MENKVMDLKPCPFCGKTKYLIVDEIHQQLDWDDIANFRIICSAGWNGKSLDKGCGSACGYQRTKEEAIALWNTRA